jgi:hypothetical protein
MYTFAVSYTGDSSGPMFTLILLTIVLGIIAYVRAAIAEKAGGPEHTRYAGKSYLATCTGLCELRAHILESLAEMLIGREVYHWNRPLGAFLVTSGICFGIVIFLERVKAQSRSRNTNDAIFEQSVNMQSARRFRGR